MIAPDALRGVLATDPKTGMDLLENQSVLRDNQLKRMNAIQDTISPVRDASLEAYDAAIKAGASPEAAQMAGQKALDDGLKPILDSGYFSDEEKQQVQTKFDPAQMRARALSYKDMKGFEEKQKADERADKREERMEHHEEVMEGLAERRLSQSGAATSFTPDMGALGAALAEKGVSLPAGLRSKEQQARMYQGLLDRHPGKTVDEIADMVKTGQIELAAQKKETQTAAGSAGKVEVAQNELKEFIPLVREASDAVPRGKFVPLNKLFQMADSSISDPNLRALKVRINSVLNAYDQLAARGGTDAAKREETRSLLLSADSPEVLDAALKSFELEADAARRAAVKATKVPELEESDTDKKPGAKIDHSKMSDDDLKKMLGIH